MKRVDMAVGFILWGLSFLLLNFLPVSELNALLIFFFGFFMFFVPSLLRHKREKQIDSKDMFSSRNITRALETLEDPDEALLYLSKAELNRCIAIFKKLGRHDIALEYQKFCDGEQYNFFNLPTGEELKKSLQKNSGTLGGFEEHKAS